VSAARVRGVYERNKGSGVWWTRWADVTGRIHRQKVGPKQLAIALYHKRKAEAREAMLFPETIRARVSFAELADDFEKAKPNHWSGRTGKGIVKTLRTWFELGPAHLITPQRIEEKLNGLASAGRTPATVNRYRSVLSAILQWGGRNGKLRSNPVRSVALRREDNQRMRFLEEAEEQKLRFAIRKLARDREPELTLALNTGMRLGEQYTLSWRDVDVRRGFIRLLKTKSGRARTIPLNADARSALLELQRRRRSELVCAGHPRAWFKRCLSAAKISEFRWHDLRHTFASRLVMAGVDLATVQELMGHQTVAMTLRYAHLSDDHKAAAVAKLVPTSPAKTFEAVAQLRSVPLRRAK
jgi:integrase